MCHLEAKIGHFETKIDHFEAKTDHFETKIDHFEAKIDHFEAQNVKNAKMQFLEAKFSKMTGPNFWSNSLYGLSTVFNENRQT